MSGYELSLSFDTDSFGGSNSYLPLIYLGLNWFDVVPQTGSPEIRRLGAFPGPDAVATGRADAGAGRSKIPMRLRRQS